jgi:hypothetical protein
VEHNSKMENLIFREEEVMKVPKPHTLTLNPKP